MSERPSATPTPEGPARARSRKIFLWISAVAAVAILLVSNEILLPFVLGLLVAYILLPAVLRIERLGLPRFVAILLVYAITLGVIAGFIALIVPSLIHEGQALKRELPHRMQQAEERWGPAVDERLRALSGKPAAPPAEAPDETPDDDVAPPAPDGALVVRPRPDGAWDVHLDESLELRRVNDDVWRVSPVDREREAGGKGLLKRALERAGRYLSENSGELIKLGQAILTAISRGIFNLFMTLMLGGYMMLTHEKILRFFKELMHPATQPAFDRLLHRLDRGLAGVVRGQLLICVVNGVLSAIGFWLFDLKYWPLMALIAAVGSLIPIFGSILSAVPAVAIGLTQSPGTAVAVLAWILGIHQLEANFLNPKIIGDAAKIHPVLVVFSLLVGEHFFQIKGALFAVPCLSILQTLFLHFRETTMGLSDPTATMPPPPKAEPSG